MTNISKGSRKNIKYIISSLVITCFRAFQWVQRLEFSTPKGNMIILAPNSFGKTGTIDSLEYILSEEGTVERIGELENKVLNQAGSVALKNIFRTSDSFPTSVRAEIDVYDTKSDEKIDTFSIEQTVLEKNKSSHKNKSSTEKENSSTQDQANGKIEKSRSKKHTKFLDALKISPIIRGEESNSFVTALTPVQRFDKIAVWIRRKSLLGVLKQLGKVLIMSPATLTTIRSEIVKINDNTANITNKKILIWNEPDILRYINNELLNQFEPKLRMTNLTNTDSAYLHLKESIKKLTPPYSKDQKNLKQQSKNTLQKILVILDQLIHFSEEYSRLQQSERNVLVSIENTKIESKVASRELFSRMQREVDQLHKPMNQFFQHITGVSGQKVNIQIELDEHTDEGQIHLTTDFTEKLTGLQPSGYLSNAEKHAFALAFQLAYIKEFNQDAKILILDDLVTSIDAGYRNRIVNLLLKEFSDFQIIATTHDDLFFLSLYASANTDEWTFCRIIKFDPTHGPVFDKYHPTIEEMQFLWDHNLSALTLLRQQMEHDFEQLIVDLSIKMRVLKPVFFDSYSLNEKINAVKGYFKEVGLIIPKLDGVQKETLDYFGSAKYVNKGIHYHDQTHSSVSVEDEKVLKDQYYEFKSWLVCSTCCEDRYMTIGRKKPQMVCRNCDKRFKFNKKAGSPST